MNEKISNRRYEIDWIKNISILVLFVYHTSAIFCRFGDFYIISEEKNLFADLFILLFFVWYMPMLFFLAGASTYFASQKRDLKNYLKERAQKLLVPLLFGLLVFIPPQTYLARLWRGEDGLNYIEHLKYFFTTVTDFTGFDGAFTPAHLWFILYLFVVSVLGGLLIYKLLKTNKGNLFIENVHKLLLKKWSIFILIGLGMISDIFPSIMGKSILGCLILFIIGYITYQDINIINAISKHRRKFLLSFISVGALGILYVLKIRPEDINITILTIDSFLKNSLLVSAILFIVGYSSIYLNKRNKLLDYLNKYAFSIYILHQPILLFIAFIIIPKVSSTYIAMFLIITISFIVTAITNTILSKFKIFKKVLSM